MAISRILFASVCVLAPLSCRQEEPRSAPRESSQPSAEIAPAVDSVAGRDELPESVNTSAQPPAAGQSQELLRAFESELADTISGGYAGQTAESIGAHGDVALVLITYLREATPNEPFYRLFSYNRSDGSRSPVLSGRERHPDLWVGLRLWETARLTYSGASDMLVLHQDCLDCEATYWLTSLWLTPEKIWQARTWEGGYAWDIENPGDQPSSDVRVFIGSDGLFGDYFTDYSCAFGVWRQNEDGREELATYCVKTMTPEGGTEPPTVQTVASVFEIDASGSRCRTIRDEPRQVEILQGICERNPSHDLCNSI